MTKQLSFFNTISLKGEELKEATEKAMVQEDMVLFIMCDGQEYTPFEVQEIYNRIFSPVPITSIRRAITVLTDKGKLEKLDEMKEGNYGKPNHKWRLKLK